jgi:hypothetical protein
MTSNLTSPQLAELAQTQQLCAMLLKTPHYAKMGAEGIFAIVSKASKIGIDPVEALNGGLYYVKGKVEMSAQMMNALIREGKHSVTKDKRSDDTICILHGKRADTGDTWTESFSLQDAQRAGLINNPTWKAHPKSMLFARALSLLARQLFPDVIRGCYVEGEIADEPLLKELKDESSVSPALLGEDPSSDLPTPISQEELQELTLLLDKVPAYKLKVIKGLEGIGKQLDRTITREMYDRIVQTSHALLEEEVQ